MLSIGGVCEFLYFIRALAGGVSKVKIHITPFIDSILIIDPFRFDAYACSLNHLNMHICREDA